MQVKIKGTVKEFCSSANALYATLFTALAYMNVCTVHASDIFGKVETEGINLFGNLQRIGIIAAGVFGLAAIIQLLATSNPNKAEAHKSKAIKCIIGVFVCIGFTFFISWAKNLASGAPDIGSLL